MSGLTIAIRRWLANDRPRRDWMMTRVAGVRQVIRQRQSQYTARQASPMEA
jgi:hypothetical protein